MSAGEPRGIYPMLYAFFSADGGLDRAAMRAQAEACVAARAHGAAILGLASEVGKLSRQEQADEAEAERLYRDLLPTLVFLFQSLETLLCYGKRLAALRLGLGPVHDREPALGPSAFGLDCLARYAAALGPFGA